MRVIAGAACGVLVLIVLGCAASIYSGLWIPNQPTLNQFPVRGVDVSAHQGEIDWNAVARSGIQFAYLKATEGGDFRDVKFAGNLKGANKAGIACGAYHFYRLGTDPMAQAENFIMTVPSGTITLPPAVDLEFTGNTSVRPSVEAFHKEFDQFVGSIEKVYGRRLVIYAGDDFSETYLNGYSIDLPWVRAVVFGPERAGSPPWMFWQYSERGRVPGIRGFVDLDVYSGSAQSLKPPQ